MIPKLTPLNAHKVLKDGGIIIYPTEGIYGIGCDPFNQESVNKVFSLKGRDKEKSFIIICSDVNQLIEIIDESFIDCEELSQKNFITWIVPAHNNCPSWLRMNSTVAVRITNHPVIESLCERLNGPIISTSANYSTHEYVNDIKTIETLCRIDTKNELEYYKNGGILQYVLRNMI